MIGMTRQGMPVVRTSFYSVDAPGVLKLATSDGATVQAATRRGRSQQRETCFDGWDSAADAAWMALGRTFPGHSWRGAVLQTAEQRCLEIALSTTYSYVARWDPFVRFCGVPGEATQGFVLSGEDNEHGELIFQRPDIWMLRWKAPPDAVYESWSVALPQVGADLVRGDFAS
ncbi:MAG: hypothetical protein M3Z31_14975 [Pseudomonadota bacterium]|nr:hypothetical protein [Pseudomonadota bacterium]